MRQTNMLRASIALLFGMICLGLGVGTASAETMKPGKWEVSTTGDVEKGGKKVPVRSEKNVICLNAQQAKQTTEAPPAGNTGCTVQTLEKSPKKLVTRITCGDITIDSTTVWNAKAYQSLIRSSGLEGGQKVTTTLNAKGQYLGACTQ